MVTEATQLHAMVPYQVYSYILVRRTITEATTYTCSTMYNDVGHRN